MGFQKVALDTLSDWLESNLTCFDWLRASFSSDQFENLPEAYSVLFICPTESPFKKHSFCSMLYEYALIWFSRWLWHGLFVWYKKWNNPKHKSVSKHFLEHSDLSDSILNIPSSSVLAISTPSNSTNCLYLSQSPSKSSAFKEQKNKNNFRSMLYWLTWVSWNFGLDLW